MSSTTCSARPAASRAFRPANPWTGPRWWQSTSIALMVWTRAKWPRGPMPMTERRCDAETCLPCPAGPVAACRRARGRLCQPDLPDGNDLLCGTGLESCRCGAERSL
ncbi:UNVERIFIED_CONTAM: hypothetical protein NCL1_00015 [Trichonephila clavipes]